MNKFLVICGPTATGKTSLGIKLAQKFDGEIVNADSRQVYRGMDVGTGKEIQSSKFKVQTLERGKYNIGYYLISGVRVWLLDVVEPSYRFSVADYVNCAVPAIEGIWKRGKLPILVGGTGFYIKALIDGIDTMGVEPDWELREKFKNTGTKKLQEFLKRIDAERFNGMNQSDRNNPRRLVRAIEIAKNPLPNSKILKLTAKDILMIGLKASYKKLYERIDKRVEKRLEEGLIKEIKSLIGKGYNFDNSVLGETIAYKEWEGCLENGQLKGEIVQKWKYNEHHYARRQMTWFRKEERINWFDITSDSFLQNIEKLVRKWYIKKEVKG